MNSIKVNEVFETIQGEAAFTGSPSVFLRLQGCPVGCGWCDTKHTWDVLPENEVSQADIIAKTDDSPQYFVSDAKSIAEMVANSYQAKHVVITGGEPCMIDLTELTTELLERGLRVQIETSGTFEIKVHPDAWVTLSPKINMPGGLPVLDSSYDRANEIKYPVGNERDISVVIEQVAQHARPTKLLWLQPLSQSKKATDICIAAATLLDARVSIQTHKFIGIR